MFDSTCHGKLQLSWTEPRCLNTETILELPSDLSVVYALLAYTPLRPHFVVFYIGQTGDAVRRLLEHLRSISPFRRAVHEHLSTYFTVAHVSNAVLRLAAEGALIRMLRPVGNDVQPNTFPVAVTPPPTNILPCE